MANSNNLYFGVIEDNHDPKRLGRVQVRVFGVHDKNKGNLPTEKLPWCLVMTPTTSPGISGLGHTPFMVQGGMVILMDLWDAEQNWIVLGTLPTIANVDIINPFTWGDDEGFKDPDSVFPRIGDTSDINSRARNSNSGDYNNIPVGKFEPERIVDSSYPDNHVYETKKGHIKEYDDSDTAPRIYEKHSSGTFYEMGPNGDLTTKVVGDNYQLVIGKDTLEVFGNINIITNGDCNITAEGNIDALAKGNIIVSSKSHVNISVDGMLDMDVNDIITLKSHEQINLFANDKIVIKETPLGYCSYAKYKTKGTCESPADGSLPGVWTYIKDTVGIRLEAVNDIEIVGDSNLSITVPNDNNIKLNVLDEDGVDNSGNGVEITKDLVLLKGNLEVEGDIKTSEVDSYNDHIHSQGNTNSTDGPDAHFHSNNPTETAGTSN